MRPELVSQVVQFNYKYYINQYKDINHLSYEQALKHYVNRGFSENRKCNNKSSEALKIVRVWMDENYYREQLHNLNLLPIKGYKNFEEHYSSQHSNIDIYPNRIQKYKLREHCQIKVIRKVQLLDMWTNKFVIPYNFIIHNFSHLVYLALMTDNIYSKNPVHASGKKDSIIENTMITPSLGFEILPAKKLNIVFSSKEEMWGWRDFNIFQYHFFYILSKSFWKNAVQQSAPTDGSQEIVINYYNNLKDKINPSYEDLTNVYAEHFCNLLFNRVCGCRPSEFEIQNFKNDMLGRDLNPSINHCIQKFNVKNNINLINTKLEKMTIKLGRKPKVLFMIAYLETMNKYFIEKMMENVRKTIEKCPEIEFGTYFENINIPKKDTDYTPWSRVARARNYMMERINLDDWDYLYWIDSDIVEYNPELPKRALSLNPKGITAPVMCIEESNIFYDWCGYIPRHNTIQKPDKLGYIYGRQIGLIPPYDSRLKKKQTLNPPLKYDDNELVELDCVGCMYIVPTYIFKCQYKKKTKEKLRQILDKHNSPHKLDNKVRYEDHPAFTDHYPVCCALIDEGEKIYLDRLSIGYHADLPKYGLTWAGSGPR